MVPIDGDLLGRAEAELRAAGQQAVANLRRSLTPPGRGVHPASYPVIAAAVTANARRHDRTYPMVTVAVLKKIGTEGVSWKVAPELAYQAVDWLLADRGCPPHHLLALYEAYGDAAVRQRDGRRVSREFRVQVGVAPPVAEAVQLRPEVTGQLWRRDADPAGAEPSAVVLTSVARGGAGTGKSQIAREVWQQALDTLTPVMVWVKADSRQTIVSTMAAAAVRAGLSPADHGDDEAAAALLVGWLEGTPLSWLLVLDNVWAARDMHRLWPAPGRNGRVLVTTRLTDLHLAGAAIVPVGLFSPEQAQAYLSQRIAEENQASQAHTGDGVDDLVEAVGLLPLALAQAAAYVIQQGLTCGQYADRFRDRRRALVSLFPRDPTVADDYEHSVTVSLLLALDAADRLTEPPGLARPALTLAAVADPDGIPDGVWTGDAGRRFLTQALPNEQGGVGADAPRPEHPAGEPVAAAPTVVSEEAAWSALRALHRYSVITHTPGDPHSVRVHELVQRSQLDGLRPQPQADPSTASAIRSVADTISALWPPNGYDAQLDAILTALERNDYQSALCDRKLHPLLYVAASRLGHAGQVAAALTRTQALRGRSHKSLGPDHADTLTTRNNLAHWRGEAGDPAGAVTALEALLGDCLRVLGPDHPDTLTTRNNLAHWRGEAGDPAGAVTALEALLGDRLRVLGPDHPDTLTTRHNLAGRRGQAGDPAGAVTALEALLGDCLRVLGPDHPDTLTTRHNLAGWRGQAGDPAGAVTALEALLGDCLRVLGPDHPDTLTTRHNLAGWRGEAGDPAGAVTALEALLGDCLRVLGPDHPDTLTTRNNLARRRGEAGDPAGAVTALEALLGDRLRVLGPDHPDTLTTRNNLAHWRGQAGDPAGAVTALEALLGDRLRVLGPDHPDTLTTRHNLAGRRGQAGDPAGAVTALEALLGDRLRVLGPDHPDTLNTRNNLAYWRSQVPPEEHQD